MIEKSLEWIERKISLEATLAVLFVLYLAQALYFYDHVNQNQFLITTVLAGMGVLLGLFSTSLILILMNILLIFLGTFLLFFDPIIMDNSMKLFIIFAIPVYSIISYLVKRSLFIRKLLSLKQKDIRDYLKNRDPLTGYRSLDSFNKKYDQYISSLSSIDGDSHRIVGVSMYYVDFYEQYAYQDEKATESLIREMADSLCYLRRPEELFFYLQKGKFLVLSVAYDNDEERERLKLLNEKTKENIEKLKFSSESVHGITVRKGEMTLTEQSTYTPEQVLSFLNRRAEADLAAEYVN